MKMADILHSIADMLDQQEQGGHDEHQAPGMATVEVEPGDNGESEVMVPPLQQKLELLKKASGVASHYDDQGHDELDDIKKLTGIGAVMHHEGGEDNDITG